MPTFSCYRTVVAATAVVVAALSISSAPANAQLPQTRLYVVSPAGAQVGSITEVTIARGDDLDEIDTLLFSHPGIFATPVMQETPTGPQPVANKFRVAVAKDVPPGRYEVRAGGLFGVSNPRTFMIGRRAELQETEPNQTVEQAQQVAVGSVVNGLINGAGDIDLFRFSAKASQRVVLDCQAQRIDSRLNPTLTLMDATGRPIKFAENAYYLDDLLVFDVPADGVYLVQLRDVAFTGSADHVYRLAIHTDPHIRFTIPAAGQAGTTGKFTLYGFNLPGSERTESTSAGAPLEKLMVDIAVPARSALDESLAGVPSNAAGLDLFAYHLDAANGSSNTVFLGVTDGTVASEQEPNNEPSAAQKIAAPVDLTGQFAPLKDLDIYALDAKKDQEFHIEIVGQRGGVPIDPVLKVDQVTVDDKGTEQVKQLTNQDDFTTNLAANSFDTATDDPVFRLKAPVDGTYRLSVRDRAYEHNGHPDLVYRLIVRTPQPDFRLVAVPSGSVAGKTWPVSLRRGDHFAIDVLVFRRDGFTGPIEIAPSNLPYGMEVTDLTIPENGTKGTLILTATADAASSLVPLRLDGTATLDMPSGPKLLKHPIRAGSVVWNQADPVPAVSRLTDSFTVGVMQEPAPYLVSHQTPRIEVFQGRQVLIPLKLATPPPGPAEGEAKPGLEKDLVIKPTGLPKDAKIQAGDVTIPKGQTSQTMRLFVQPDSPPRTYVVQWTGQVEVPYRRNLAKVARLETAKTHAIEKEQQLKVLADQATAQANDVATRLKQATEQVTQTQAVVTAKEQQLAEGNKAVAQAVAALDAATKNAAALEEQSKKAAADAEAAKKAATEAADDDAAKTQAAEAEKAAAAAAAALATAKTAVEQAKQQHTTAAAQVKQATDELAAAKEPLPKQQQAQQSLQAEKQKADQFVALRTEAHKPAEAARKAAEKAATDAANAAKPKNLNVTQPLPPIVVVVKPAPVKLDVKLSAAEVKKGASVDATVTITRQNGFAGPVNLSVGVPAGDKGPIASEFTVPADGTTGILKFTIAENTAPGVISNLVVRAVVDLSGEAIVEAPITVKVVE